MRSEFFNTLKVEWLKVRNYRTFWILLVVTAACMPAFNYVIYDFTDNSLPKFNGQSILGNPFSFPAVWRTVPYNSGLLVFLPAILVITLFTNEFSFRTHRQNIIDGWSRSRFIHIKLLEVLALTIGVTILVALTCVCFGFLTKTLSVRPHWNDVRFIFYFFVVNFNNTPTFCINAQDIFHFGKIFFYRFRYHSGGSGKIELFFAPLSV